MEDWPARTILAKNHRKRPATTELWFGDGKAACAGPFGMAATRDNSHVDDKLLNDDDDDDDGEY